MLFETHTINSGRPGPALLIIAGVHGDEYEGVEAVRRLMTVAEEDLACGSVTLVPVANLSAFEAANRTGEDGLDLARTFPGAPDGSITERVAHALFLLIKQSDAFIDLHSGGKLFRLSPLVGYMLVDDHSVLDLQRRMAQAFGLPIVWGTTAALDGRSLSAARDAGVPAIYAEYLGGGACSADGVAAYVDGCLRVMALLGITGPPTTPDNSQPTLDRHVVEDPRAGSGHLQVRNPSPIAGTIEYDVALDDWLSAGDIIARVRPSDGGDAVAVRADTSGRVICLAAGSHVEAGVSVAVVMEPYPPES
ncbi:MAG: M14 family metallopeptidase [Rhodothermales bacterium]